LIVMLMLAGYMVLSPNYRSFHLFSRLSPLRISAFREILSLGFPIAITISAETGLFSAVSVLMGTRGTAITAAHQIALNFASTMFMIPLALSAATTILIGQQLGAGRTEMARISGTTGILLCGGFMVLSATFLLVFRDAVVGLYTDDVAVTGIAISLLLIAAVFQIADGIQIGAAGALRGYKDTAMPMLINIIAYWVFAFPLAYAAAISFKAPPNYVWGGFVVGLGIAAILLSWRFARLSRSAMKPARPTAV